MNKNNILFSFENVPDIMEICKPLMDATPINFFHYFKTDVYKKTITLTSNGSWLEHWLARKYYEYSSFLEKPSTYQHGYKLTSSLKQSIPIVEDAVGHKIGPGLVFIKPHKDFCEFFLFCTDPKYVGVNQFLIDNLNILEKFTLYFKDKARVILKKADEKKIYFPVGSEIKTVNNDENSHKIDISLEFNRYYIDDKNYLTKKQIECIYWLSQGKSNDEIASIIGSSPRTIEKHLEISKNKLGVFKSTALIYRAVKLGFI